MVLMFFSFSVGIKDDGRTRYGITYENCCAVYGVCGGSEAVQMGMWQRVIYCIYVCLYIYMYMYVYICIYNFFSTHIHTRMVVLT